MIRIHARGRLALLALAPALMLSACNSGADTSSSSAGGQKVTYNEKDSIPKDPAEAYYKQVCMACHATGVGPEILGRDLPVEAVKMFVRNGNRAMPAFPESMLDDAMLDAVAKMVSESKAPAVQPAPSAQ